MSRKTIGLVVSVLVIIGVALAYLIFWQDTEPDCCAPNEQRTTTVLPINGVDGDIEFTVTEIECGIKRVGDEVVGRDAEGGFCKVFVQVKNNSADDKRLFASDQRIVTTSGESVAVDPEVQYYVANSSWYDKIPAGDFASGKLVWDLPLGDGIDAFEFQANPDSQGVKLQYASN